MKTPIDIETPKLENGKFIEEQMRKIIFLETALKTANEKNDVLEKQINEELEKQKPIKMIKNGIGKDGRIHEHLLMYILKIDKLDYAFTVSGVYEFRRVFLGDGYYDCKLIS